MAGLKEQILELHATQRALTKQNGTMLTMVKALRKHPDLNPAIAIAGVGQRNVPLLELLRLHGQTLIGAPDANSTPFNAACDTVAERLGGDVDYVNTLLTMASNPAVAREARELRILLEKAKKQALATKVPAASRRN